MIIETIPSKKNYFFDNNPLNAESHPQNKCLSIPSCGIQNILLNNLLNAGIIDENYRLIKNIELPPLPKLSHDQLEHITKFFTSMLSVSIEGKSFAFPVQDLMKRLYDKHRQDFISIDIVGGFLRVLIRTSKDFCIEALKLLGLKNPESLLDESFLTASGPLKDIDIRFRCPQKELNDINAHAQEIINFMSESSKIPENDIKSHAFTKFCPVSLPRNTKETHTVFKVVSFGKMILQNISATPVALECLFVKKLKRESLFLQDALKVDIKKLIENLGADLFFESDLQQGWQSFIDILTQVIHVNDPSSVDFGGFPMLVSYFSRGYILGDEKIEEQDVLATLRETFFFPDPSKKNLFEQTSERLDKYLSNHHERDLTSTVTFLFNFFSCLDREKLDEFSKLWKAKCSPLESENNVTSKINKAFCKHNLSFEIVKAILCLAGFCALGSSSVILKKHRKQLTLQIKLQDHNSSYLLIPYLPEEALQEFQRWKNDKPSEESQKLLISLFEEISKNHSSYALEVSEIPEISLPTRKEMHSLLGYMVNTLILATGKWRTRTEELFYLFPFAITHKFSKEKEAKVLLRLIQELEHTPYDFLIPKLEKISVTDPFHAKKFIRSWISLLAESQDKKLCGIAKKLRFDFHNIYSQEDPQDLIQKLLPVGVFEAQKILQKLQASSTLDLKKEKEIIIKILNALEKERLSESLKEMCLIYDNFLRKNAATKEIDKDFEKACLSFIETLIKVNYEYNAEVVLEKLIKGNFVSPSNSKTSTLWLKLCHIQQKSGFHLRAYDVYKKGKKLTLWTTAFKASKSYLNLAFLLVENLELTHQPKAFKIFDIIINSLKINETTRARIGVLVKKHIEFLFSTSKNDTLSQKIIGEYKIHLDLSERHQYLSKLIEKYIEAKNNQKALEVWLQLIDLKLYEKAAVITEILLSSLLSDNKSEEIVLIVTHSSFVNLTLFFRQEWIVFINTCLKNIQKDSKQSDLYSEYLIKLVFNCCPKIALYTESKETLRFFRLLLGYLTSKNRKITYEFKETLHSNIENLKPYLFKFEDNKRFYVLLDFFEKEQIPLLDANECQKIISNALDRKNYDMIFFLFKKLIKNDRSHSFYNFYYDLTKRLIEIEPLKALQIIDELNNHYCFKEKNIDFNILTIKAIEKLTKNQKSEAFNSRYYLVSDFLLNPLNQIIITEDFAFCLIAAISMGLQELSSKRPWRIEDIEKLINHSALLKVSQNLKATLCSLTITFANIFYKGWKEVHVMFLISSLRRLKDNKATKKKLAKEIIKNIVFINAEEAFKKSALEYLKLFENDIEKDEYELLLIETILHPQYTLARSCIDNLIEKKFQLLLLENQQANFLKLIEKYIFSTALNETELKKIDNWCSKAIEKGFFKNHREKFLPIQIFSFSAKKLFCPNDSFEFLEKIFDFLLEERHDPMTVILVIQLLSEAQNILLSRGLVVNFYNKLIKKIEYILCFASETLQTASIQNIQASILSLNKIDPKSENQKLLYNQRKTTISFSFIQILFNCFKQSRIQCDLEIVISQILYSVTLNRCFNSLQDQETALNFLSALDSLPCIQFDQITMRSISSKKMWIRIKLISNYFKTRARIPSNHFYTHHSALIKKEIIALFENKKIIKIQKFLRQLEESTHSLFLDINDAVELFEALIFFIKKKMIPLENNYALECASYLNNCFISPTGKNAVSQNPHFHCLQIIINEIDSFTIFKLDVQEIQYFELILKCLCKKYELCKLGRFSLDPQTKLEFQNKCLHLFKEILLKLAEKAPLVYLNFSIDQMICQKYLSEPPKIIELNSFFFEKIKDLKMESPPIYQAHDERSFCTALIKLLVHRMEYAKFFSKTDCEDYHRHISLVVGRAKYLWDKSFPEKSIFFDSIYMLLDHSYLNLPEKQIYLDLKEYFMQIIMN